MATGNKVDMQTAHAQARVAYDQVWDAYIRGDIRNQVQAVRDQAWAAYYQTLKAYNTVQEKSNDDRR